MSTGTNKAAFRQIVEELMNNKNYDVVDDLFSPDFVEHEEIPGIDPGLEGMHQAFQMFHNAFPDLQVTIEDLLADGDKIVARELWNGTHQGEFMGMPATGKQVSFSVIDIVRFGNGKLVEHWAVSDMLALMTQLGAIPEPESVGI